MNKTSIVSFFIILSFFVWSCEKKLNLTDSEKSLIIESAQSTVEKVFEASNNHKFLEGLKYYSMDSDCYFTSNGEVFNLEELKQSYSEIGPSVEVLENSIINWNATFISENTVAFTLPIHLKLKLIGTPEYNGELVWTAIVQKRNEKWVIVQSHESWLNCVEVATALTPITTGNE